ncbi:MAG: PilZ domain-containing protein [Phycisphaerae bacterium]|jgi:c-di-GMP-binding flagellar brake protein YcgR
MDNTQKTDRRRHQRHPLVAGVRFQHAPSASEFPGRAVDISDGGMLMYVPVSAPVKAGQPIRLTLRGVRTKQFGGLSDKTLDARIVHVQREGLLVTGKVAIGVEFLQA